MRALSSEHAARLAPIPVHDVGAGLGPQTLRVERGRAETLFDEATRGVPRSLLAALDAISRRWLVRSASPLLDEIDTVAREIGRPGVYFLSVNYEWGCTCRVGPSPDGRSARLVRVLDWRTEGLGRYVMAARVQAPAGVFVALTWPGYTGVLQAMAPGRFALAINQAPMRRSIGVLAADWLAGRHRVWRTRAETAAHVARQVCETARSFAEARDMLSEIPIAAPAIFSLAGIAANECAVIERGETVFAVHDGEQAAANHWLTPEWRGRARGHDSLGRARQMRGLIADLDAEFGWLAPPVLNERTRLVMMADARDGALVAQGFEADGPATLPLVLNEMPGVDPDEGSKGVWS